jgi:hypothetical protein
LEQSKPEQEVSKELWEQIICHFKKLDLVRQAKELEWLERQLKDRVAN